MAKVIKPRTKRGLALVGGLISLGLALFLVLKTFQSNLVFFFSPTEVFEQKAPVDRPFRIGGLVAESSIQRDRQSLRVRFTVTDLAHQVPVIYEGLLPDLFQEGKGVVAQGRLTAEGVFVAHQVLAKHDENYMPPEAAEALEKAARKIQARTAATLTPAESSRQAP